MDVDVEEDDVAARNGNAPCDDGYEGAMEARLDVEETVCIGEKGLVGGDGIRNFDGGAVPDTLAAV